MNNRKIAAILIAAIASSVHSQEIRDVGDSSRTGAEHCKRVPKKDAAKDAYRTNDSAKSRDTFKTKECPQNPYKEDTAKNQTGKKLTQYDKFKAVSTDIGNLILAFIALAGKFSAIETRQRKSFSRDLIFAAFIALAALGVTCWLVYETRRGIRRQLRAYVGWASFSTTPTQTDVHVKNYGSTPAHDLTFQIDIRDKAMTLAEIKRITSDIRAIEVLFPGQVHGRVGRGPLEKPCFICGLVNYRDEFGKRHTTTFQVNVLEDGTPMTWEIGNTAT